MALTTQEVRHVALLARIGIDDAGISVLEEELNELFDHIDMLEKLDIEGVEPTIRPNDAVNVMRDDITHDSLGIANAMKNAPAHEQSAFLVPRIVAPGGDQDE